MKGRKSLENNQIQAGENTGKRRFLRRGEGIARFSQAKSATTRSQKNPKRVERSTHSAPPGGRSENKAKMSSTTPTINPDKVRSTTYVSVLCTLGKRDGMSLFCKHRPEMQDVIIASYKIRPNYLCADHETVYFSENVWIQKNNQPE